jgi:hypothetical protein
MPETMSACPPSRVVRRLAVFRACRIPLVLALALLAYSTTHATMDCFSSPGSDAQAVEAKCPETEQPGAVPNLTGLNQIGRAHV